MVTIIRNARQKTKREISQEIDMRQRTIKKFAGIAGPLKEALSELDRRLAFEREVIDYFLLPGSELH